jgi:hypothetical protein
MDEYFGLGMDQDGANRTQKYGNHRAIGRPAAPPAVDTVVALLSVEFVLVPGSKISEACRFNQNTMTKLNTNTITPMAKKPASNEGAPFRKILAFTLFQTDSAQLE